MTDRNPVYTEPNTIWLGTRLLVCEGLPGWQPCTAKTRKGPRCKMSVQADQIAGWTEIHVPGGVVTAYNLGADFADMDRWEAQRCERHWPDAEPFVAPEWEDFDPAAHQAVIYKPSVRLLAWDSKRGVHPVEFTPAVTRG